MKLSHARTLAHTHKRPCARTHTHIAQARRQGKRGAARETNAEQHSQHTAACACIRSQDMRMHRARACLACVRRSVVGAHRRDAHLRQGDARERRVVPLRRTVVISPGRVAAQIESPEQSAHTVSRVSATRRRPPRMPPATIPEARRLDRSPHSCCRMLACMRVRTYSHRDVSIDWTHARA